MQPMSSLGGKKVHRQADYNTTNIGRVTSIEKFKKFGIIEVVFLDHGQPFPVWVVNDIEREPVEGDQVVIGYINGRKDAPYLAGFVKNYNYTTNFVTISKDLIRLQLPIYEIGVKGGKSHKDTEENLLKDEKLKRQRAYVELTPEHALMSFPEGISEAHAPGYVKITSSGIELWHATGNVKVTSHGELPTIKTTVL